MRTDKWYWWYYLTISPKRKLEFCHFILQIRVELAPETIGAGLEPRVGHCSQSGV
jgi:hypothetical protein